MQGCGCSAGPPEVVEKHLAVPRILPCAQVPGREVCVVAHPRTCMHATAVAGRCRWQGADSSKVVVAVAELDPVSVWHSSNRGAGSSKVLVACDVAVIRVAGSSKVVVAQPAPTPKP